MRGQEFAMDLIGRYKKGLCPVDVGFNYQKISSGYYDRVIIGKPLDFSEILLSDLFSERTKILLICELVEKSVKKNTFKKEGKSLPFSFFIGQKNKKIA